MRAPALLLSLAATGLLAPASLAAAAGKARAPRQAPAATSTCASYDQRPVEQGLDLSLRNSCDAPLRCSLRWTLTCQTAKGRSVHPEATSFELSEHELRSVTASMAACGSEATWRINQVRWSCRVDEASARRPSTPASRGRGAP